MIDQSWLIVVSGGIGEDVWDKEFIVHANKIKDAIEMVEMIMLAENLDGDVFSAEAIDS
jgi:hypothetical protein